MPKGMGVQVPPRAPLGQSCSSSMLRPLCEAFRTLRARLVPIASWQYGIALSCRRSGIGAVRIRPRDHPFQVFHNVAAGSSRQRSRRNRKNDRHESTEGAGWIDCRQPHYGRESWSGYLERSTGSALSGGRRCQPCCSRPDCCRQSRDFARLQSSLRH